MREPIPRSRRISRRSLLQAAAGVGVAIKMGLLSLSRAGLTRAGAPTRGYPIQLHVHAHSAHTNVQLQDLEGRLPSMRWQSAKSLEAGVDTLWWSEHDHALDQRRTWSRTWDPPLVLDNQRLILAPSTNVREIYRIWPPLSARPRLTLNYERSELPRGSEITVTFKLSWHPSGEGPVRHRYEVHLVGPNGGTKPALVGPGLIRERLATPPHGVVTIPIYPLFDDSGQQVASQDNCLGSIRISARGGATLTLKRARLACRDGEPSVVARRAGAISRKNARELGTTEYMSLEHTRNVGKDDPRSHFNVYLPEGNLAPEPDASHHSLADEVHARGGLLSVNHPFGTARGGGPGGEQEETIVRARALELAGNNFRRADILEVGYLDGRGKVSGDGHLMLWDLALANSAFLLTPRFIRAVGVNDSHGEGPGLEPLGGTMCTWLVPAADTRPTRPETVELMRQGRMFFGNYRLFPADGLLDFSVGGIVMGGEGDSGQDISDLSWTLAPDQPGTSLWLREVPLLTTAADWDIVLPPRQQLLTNPFPVVTPAGTRKAFRLELRDGANRLVLATNPAVVSRA